MQGEMIEIVGGTSEILGRLSAALGAGIVLGVNRDLRGKPAGVRTHGLVAIGSCLVTLITMELSFTLSGFHPDSVSRAIQGIITGIGFIGGGVILKVPATRSVQGLTTVASIWITACLGIAFGAGMWRTALLALALTFIVLMLGGALEDIASRLFKGRERPEGWEGE